MLKQNVALVTTVDTKSVLKRLQSELMSLVMGGDPGVSAFPEEYNIFTWKGTIQGSKETVFEGTEYKLTLHFPADYPFKPPKVKFKTACFHPNVNGFGNICLDLLQDKWSSAYNVRTILLSTPAWRAEYQLAIKHTSCCALEQSRRFCRIQENGGEAVQQASNSIKDCDD